MSIKIKIKELFPGLSKIYTACREIYPAALTVVSPTLNTKYRYRQFFGEHINLKNPKTLSEKILWLKLNNYNKNPLVVKCADKYSVRDYIKECGLGDLLVDIIGCYERVDDIPWEELPQKFVLKWNFGAGMNVICKDKSSLDIQKTKKQLKKMGKKEDLAFVLRITI